MKTDELDETIKLLNAMLGSATAIKEKLQITDRLIRCHSLKYKHGDDNKGTKFSDLGSQEPSQ